MSFRWTLREGTSYRYTYDPPFRPLLLLLLLHSGLYWTIVVLQFDITFPAMPCEWISLDLMDISGELHLDVVSLHDTSQLRAAHPCHCIHNSKKRRTCPRG